MIERKKNNAEDPKFRSGTQKRGGYAAGDRKPIAEWNPPPQGPAPGATVNSGTGDVAEPSASALQGMALDPEWR